MHSYILLEVISLHILGCKAVKLLCGLYLERGEKKTKQKPCSLFPVLMLIPQRHHVSLAGQCINIYFCSECCCTSVVSLWTTLASLTDKEHITAAWVSSLIHRISWFLALNGASVQVRFCPPVISNGDQRVIILHFGAASNGCWSVRVYSYTELKKQNKSQRQLNVVVWKLMLSVGPF